MSYANQAGQGQNVYTWSQEMLGPDDPDHIATKDFYV